LNARLDLDIRKCQEEVSLLQPKSALGDLPEPLVRTLMEVIDVGLQRLGPSWQDGFSPMHWAAQNGRRDIMIFLMRQEGGMQLLQMRDDDGRTPLAVAMLSRGGSTLPQWIRENSNDADVAPFQARYSRPSVSLPEPYVRVLNQIETQGWQTIQWKNQFTMLHWAASKGHVDLCEYLLQLNADLQAVDAQGRRPRDCARHSGQSGALTLLEEAEVLPQPPAALRQRSVSRQRKATTIMPDNMTHELSQSDSSKSPESYGAAEKPVPEVYAKVMEQIDKIGWEKMQWARGFTLLHWAAKHDRPDLCDRFLRQGALPDQKDDSDRSAMDYARDSGSRAALEVLVAGPGALGEEPLGSLGTVVDRKPRDSQPVIATPLGPP